jgi:DNA-directed RNA polymerase
MNEINNILKKYILPIEEKKELAKEIQNYIKSEIQKGNIEILNVLENVVSDFESVLNSPYCQTDSDGSINSARDIIQKYS